MREPIEVRRLLDRGSEALSSRGRERRQGPGLVGIVDGEFEEVAGER